jgi:hypothetical protein
MEWSAGAIAAIRALRHRASGEGFISPYEMIFALGYDLLPGESLLGDTLRNPQTGADLHRIMRDGPFNQGGASVFGIEYEAGEQARKEGVRRVGERHVLAVLPAASLQQYGVKTDELRSIVENGELGPGFSPVEIRGRWHGLLETNVIIQFRDVREITWHEVAGVRKITLWVTGTILNELDDLASRGDSERVRAKARKFTRWLRGTALDEALGSEGLPVQDNGNVRLRVWAPGSMAGLRDTDHIEAAFALREKGVPVVIVTGDTGLIARARSNGLEIATPADDPWRLKPEMSPRERELELRLRRAELQIPPALSLVAKYGTMSAEVSVVNAKDAGAAREILIMWVYEGGQDVRALDQVNPPVVGGMVVPVRPGRFSFQQSLPFVMPPETRYVIASLTYAAAPHAIEYEIWAAGATRQSGRLHLAGDRFVQDEEVAATLPAGVATSNGE